MPVVVNTQRGEFRFHGNTTVQEVINSLRLAFHFEGGFIEDGEGICASLTLEIGLVTEPIKFVGVPALPGKLICWP
jgi:hypothetical protein